MYRLGFLSLFLSCWVSQSSFSQDAPAKLTNQELAEKIATALSETDLKGFDIRIEVRSGRVTLVGDVSDTDQQKLAEEVASRIEGVTQVVNSLVVTTDEKESRPKKAKGEDQDEPQRTHPQPLFAVPFRFDSPKKLTNQGVAEMIASALRRANLQGTDISIAFQGGVATLTGFVNEANQQKLAGQVTSRIIGVDRVENQLKVTAKADDVKVEKSLPSDIDSQTETDNSKNTPVHEAEDGVPDRDSKPGILKEISSVLPTSSQLELDAERQEMMEAYNRVGKKLMARQKELFESETLQRIEVRSVYKDKAIPLYDIYCGKQQLVIVSRCGGLNFASIEGTFVNTFQDGLYEWKSGKKTGTQYECEKRELMQLFQYTLDPGGFITSLYQKFVTQPALFLKPIERKDGARELQLKSSCTTCFQLRCQRILSGFTNSLLEMRMENT